MSSRRSIRAALRLLPIVLLTIGLLMSFAPSAFALFTNGGFESANFGSWSKTTFLNPGLLGSSPSHRRRNRAQRGRDGLPRDPGALFATMSQTDANTGNVLHYPLSGSYCAVINYMGKNQNGNALSQQAVTAASDVAPDGKIHIQVRLAGVVQNPGHTDTEQPYIYIDLRDVTKGTLLYETFNFAGTSAVWQDARPTRPVHRLAGHRHCARPLGALGRRHGQGRGGGLGLQPRRTLGLPIRGSTSAVHCPVTPT